MNALLYLDLYIKLLLSDCYECSNVHDSRTLHDTIQLLLHAIEVTVVESNVFEKHLFG